MTPGPLVSICVNNYNYAGFLAEALDSALGQDHESVEVVVVDDGSTDGSGAVLDAYDGRVTVIRQANGGQASAMNVGFAASSGEIVHFLDADDRLHPDAVTEVVAAWTPDLAKVQYRLRVIDANGTAAGVDPPADVEMPDGDVVPLLLETGTYVMPVTTGNAYARHALESVMPIPEAEFRISADGYLNALVPFHGRVRSLDADLGDYRLHGANRWALTGDVSVEALRDRIRLDLALAGYVAGAAAACGRPVPGDVPLRDPGHVLNRLASLRLEPAAHPVPGDRPGRLALAGFAAVRRHRELPAARRVFLGVVIAVVAFAPRPVARGTVRLALSSDRPTWARALARFLRRR